MRVCSYDRATDSSFRVNRMNPRIEWKNQAIHLARSKLIGHNIATNYITVDADPAVSFMFSKESTNRVLNHAVTHERSEGCSVGVNFGILHQ